MRLEIEANGEYYGIGTRPPKQILERRCAECSTQAGSDSIYCAVCAVREKHRTAATVPRWRVLFEGLRAKFGAAR